MPIEVESLIAAARAAREFAYAPYSGFKVGAAAGCRPGDFTHIAVVADTPGPVSPCGACRQVMLEMGGPMFIVLQANLRGNLAQSTVAELLPGGFTLVEPRA